MAQEQFGYDLGFESVSLFLNHEINVHGVIDGENEKVLKLVEEMEELEQFLALVRKKTDQESQRVDLQTAEERELIDHLRSREDLKHIFDPPGKYTWKGKSELENLNRLCNQHVEGPLQRQISMASEKMVLEENKLNEALSMFKAGLNRMQDLIKHISSNIQRIH